MKKIIKFQALVLCICLIIQFNTICFASESNAKGLQDLSQYQTADYEVAVLYRNGDVQVQSFQDMETLTQGLGVLEIDENVEFYQPNFKYRADYTGIKAGSDKYSSVQWYLKNDGSFSGAQIPVKSVSGMDINAEVAWEAYEAKGSVVVAVIDTGIDRWNIDLNGRMWTNTGEIAWNGKDDDGNGYVDDCWGWNFYDNSNIICSGDEDNHGTHCASVIASHAGNNYGITGIAPYENIKIMAVKVLGGKEGRGRTSDIIQGIKYAEHNGAKICNLSLGTEKDDILLKRTIQNSKMLFIAAAGNSTGANIKGKNLDYHANFPAAYPFDNVITVANLAADGRLHTSSDYGPKSVDIAAPGTDIVGAKVNGQYVFMTGTSMAAPMVTATAALVYTASPDMTMAEIKECILDNAKHLDSLRGSVGTNGMVDAGATVKSVSQKHLKEDTTVDSEIYPDNSGKIDSQNPDQSPCGTVNNKEEKDSDKDNENTNSADSENEKTQYLDDDSVNNKKNEITFIVPGIKKEFTIKIPEFIGNTLNIILKVTGGL